MASLVLAVVALRGAPYAHAQTGPRTGGPAPGDITGTKLLADLSVAANLARGVSDRDLVVTRGSLTFWSGAWGLFVQPYYLYGDVKLGANPRTKTDDERYLRTLVFYTFNRPLFAFGVAAIDASLRRRIGDRLLTGGGFGATPVNRPGMTVLGSVGLLYEDAHFDASTLPDKSVVPPRDRTVARTSLRLYGRYRLGGGIHLIHDVYLAPNVRKLEDVRAMGSLFLELPVVGGLAARVAIDATRETVIVPGTKEDDIAITFGATYRHDWALPTARAATPASAPARPR